MKTKISKIFLSSVIFFEIGLLILVFALYLLSSPQTLKYVVDRATAKYDISYDSISGSFIKTMSITNLKYHGDTLATDAEIDWNLRALISGDIEIESLRLAGVNLSRIQTLIEKSQLSSSHTQTKERASFAFPKMSISQLFLSTLPYKSDIIQIDTFELELSDIASDLKEVTIKDFSLQSHNNYSHIKVHGEIKQRVLHLTTLELDQINIPKIQQALLKLDSKKSNTPFTMVEEIVIDSFLASIKPYHDNNYQCNTLTLSSTAIHASLKNMLFSANDLVVNSTTNFATLHAQGELKENIFTGESTLNLIQKELEKFTNIIDFESLNPIRLTLLANPKSVDATISLKSKQIFTGRYKEYMSAINNLKSQLHFDINNSKLTLVTDANISSKYAASLKLKDTLTYDGTLHYGGNITISQLQHFPDYSLPLFSNAIIHYKADANKLVANLQTDKLHLLYTMYDFKKADFTLSSKELEIAKYFPIIPEALTPLKASLNAQMALDFKKTDTIMIENNITSNAINITGKTIIKGGKILANTQTTLAENSFLQKIDKNIKFNNIFPASLEIGYHDKHLTLALLGKKEYLKNDFSYDINSSYIENTLQLANDTILLKGESKHLKLYTHIYSLKSLQDALTPLYQFDKKPYDADVEITATIEDMQRIESDIKSRWFVYEYQPNHFAFAEKIKMNIQAEKGYVEIKNYRFNTYLDSDRTFYATKPSKITFKDDKVELLSLWINDGLNTTGSYDIVRQRGTLLSQASKYHYKEKEGDILFSTNITTQLNKDKIHIAGDLTILEALITYEHHQNHEISDPDIIIIQEEQAALARANENQNNLSIDISIHSQKPLTYKVPGIEVEITPDIKIWKESQKEVELLGRSVIESGIYKQGEKEFVILPGEILFGGNTLNPYLNLKAQYITNPYIIDIFVTGNLDSPIINFSSNPYLSQSDILSMLLFSTTTDSLFESSSNSSTQALTMLGNTFAKEIIKNFGITLDKLVISTNEQGGLGIEVGKKISKKITVIYTNDIVQSIKVRYQHSNSFETDLMISPESSGIDFLYKSEH